jgi:hypothetical protein
MNEYYCKINTQNEGRSPWRIEEHVRVKIVNIIVLCIDILTAIWLEI